MRHAFRNLSPMASLAIGLFGVDVIVTMQILVSGLGHMGKEIGIAIVAVVAIADLAFLGYLRRRQPQLTDRPTADE